MPNSFSDGQTAMTSTATETMHFGTLLREARQRCCLSLSQVAQKTKVPQWSLERLEAGKLDDLPEEVFVRGFIRSYARSVGLAEGEPLGLYEQALAARRRAQEALAAAPAVAADGRDMDDDGTAPRRGIGLAVFVIIVLLIATITFSLFLRQPPEAGEGLSLGATEISSPPSPDPSEC